MDDRQLAKIEVRAAAGNAGDASGSADAAVYLFDSGDFAEAADAMKSAREQAEKAMRCTAQAEWRLRRLMLETPLVSTTPAAVSYPVGSLGEPIEDQEWH